MASARSSSRVRGERGVDQDDGVEEVGGAVRGSRPARSRRPARRAVTHTSGVSASASTAPCRLASRSPRLEPERQDGPADRVHLTGEGVGVDDVRVGGLGHGLVPLVVRVIVSGDVRERRVDGCVRLVDGHLAPIQHGRPSRQTSAMRWARVSIRSTGSVSTAAFTAATRLP